MEMINKMNDKKNKRRDVLNTLFGNVDNIIDFHLIENFEINGVKLGDHLKGLYKDIDLLQKRNEKLVEVITKLHDENKSIKERLDNYGI